MDDQDQLIRITCQATITSGKEVMRLMPQILSSLHHSLLRVQGKEGKIVHGQQSIQNLNAQNRELTSIQISDEDIKALKEEFKSYSVDFSIFHDKSDQTHIFFKAQDVERVYAALSNIVKDVEKNIDWEEYDGPSDNKTLLDAAIQKAKQRAAAYNKSHDAPSQELHRQRSRGDRMP